MGVVRLHVPIVTNPDAEFYVNGKRLFLGPGEAWTLGYVLSTSSRQQFRPFDAYTSSLIWSSTALFRALLPKRDTWDRLHDMLFLVFLFLSRALRISQNHGTSTNSFGR